MSVDGGRGMKRLHQRLLSRYNRRRAVRTLPLTYSAPLNINRTPDTLTRSRALIKATISGVAPPQANTRVYEGRSEEVGSRSDGKVGKGENSVLSRN